MDKKTVYNIQFSGLSLGTHIFDYKIDNTFFSLFEYGDIKEGDVDVSLAFEKQERMIILDFTLSGFIVKPCDRCLEDVNLAIDGENRIILKYGPSYKEEDDQIITIPETTHTFNVAELIYEFIQLAQPMQCLHPDDENGISLCNQQMLDRMNSTDKEESIDPRWAALAQLKNRDKK